MTEEGKEEAQLTGGAGDAGGSDGDASAEAGDEAASGSGKKKKLLLIGLGVAIVLVIVPVALHVSGIMPLFGDKKHEDGGKDGKHKKGKKDGDLPPPPVTYELDEFLVNLNTPGRQSRFLKMTIVLELPSESEKNALQPYLPRIRDSFQLYLRELREEDVKGSAALYRLREELMLRLAKVVYPIKVNDILFKEILTQ